MEFNLSFFTGVGCGLCLGLSIFAYKRFMCSSGAKSLSETTAIVRQKLKNPNMEYKMIFVVRSDLNMGKGKIAAQCGHAAVGAYSKALKKDPESLRFWQSTGQAKIALKIDSEEELDDIHHKAKKLGLITSLIVDAGRTQIAPNTATVLGIGPAPKNVIDSVTGHLKLL